ncbi:hypothetical protein QNI26_22455, partial [Bacillus velezensis]|uniref:hypothetical protein n=2 Tax=Bacillus TaxID=1386 RepID=UPI00334D2D6C
QPDSGADQALAFFVQGRKRVALCAAERDPSAAVGPDTAPAGERLKEKTPRVYERAPPKRWG